MGYLKALVENGFKYREDWIINDRDENGISIDIVFPQIMPTAFVCNCDETAFFAIKKLKEIGYSVPDDISIVGFDNYLFIDICEPAITTIEVNMLEMARLAVDLLLKKIDNEKYIRGRQLIIKESVKNINFHSRLMSAEQ